MSTGKKPNHGQEVARPEAQKQQTEPEHAKYKSDEWFEEDSILKKFDADTTNEKSTELRFIRKIYLHLTGAIVLFTGLSYLLRNNETISKLVSTPILTFITTGRWN